MSEQPKVNPQDYFSHVYHSSQYGKVIILPRIVFSLKKDQPIEPILAKYPDVLTIEETNGVKYILRCRLNRSEDVLQVIESIQDMEQVNWCEPENLGYGNGRAIIFLTNNATPLQIVQVSACNACGYDEIGGAAKMFYAVSSYSLVLFPNPATDMVTVELQEEQPANVDLSTQRTTDIVSSGSYEIQL